MKPTKEEMLDWLRFKSEGFDDDDPEYKAIRALIEKYGEGAIIIPERIKQLMCEVCSWQMTRDIKKYPWTETDKKAFREVLHILEQYGGPRVDWIWCENLVNIILMESRNNGKKYAAEKVRTEIRSIGVEVEEKP